MVFLYVFLKFQFQVIDVLLFLPFELAFVDLFSQRNVLKFFFHLIFFFNVLSRLVPFQVSRHIFLHFLLF